MHASWGLGVPILPRADSADAEQWTDGHAGHLSDALGQTHAGDDGSTGRSPQRMAGDGGHFFLQPSGEDIRLGGCLSRRSGERKAGERQEGEEAIHNREWWWKDWPRWHEDDGDSVLSFRAASYNFAQILESPRRREIPAAAAFENAAP